MNETVITPQAKLLHYALEKLGVNVEAEHYDGHKHVDLYLPDAGIYIEVDGLQHLTDPKQIIADFKREHYSDQEKFDTIHITNGVVTHHLDEISRAIVEVVRERKNLSLIQRIKDGVDIGN